MDKPVFSENRGPCCIAIADSNVAPATKIPLAKANIATSRPFQYRPAWLLREQPALPCQSTFWCTACNWLCFHPGDRDRLCLHPGDCCYMKANNSTGYSGRDENHPSMAECGHYRLSRSPEV